MSPRLVAARLLTIALPALLLVAAPSSRNESSELRPTHAPEPRETLALRFPYDEGLLSSTARLSISPAYREIERLRPLSDPAALAALAGLLLGALSWRSRARQRGSRTSPYPPRRFAGPRAPPLQLA
jgi:hypothetical protein